MRGRFKPGESGNPNGRPKGTGKAAEFRDALEKHRLDLLEKTVELALGGDLTAIKLCLDRIFPPLKHRDAYIDIDFPQDATLAQRGEILIQLIADGELTPDTGTRLLQGLSAQAHLVEFEDLIERIEALEKAAKPGEN